MRREHTGRRRNEAAREDILEAAAALIADPGGGPVTVDAIAARAGVGKQTIYRWWPSKHAVVLDAMLERARIDVTEDGDLRTFLVGSFVGAQRVRGFLATAMALAQTDPAAREMLAEFTARRRDALRRLLERLGVAEPGLIVEQAYGVMWYRIMLTHEPLTAETAERLADALTAQALVQIEK
ncbi:TetR/AcrR family transcriptional regulator [Dactylosporangium salmoneum]|uniref:TetR/AcrR family transcriptional regulator n=1 Tax=Dactylosporangium salmoneum TaxID=53361 RepID=A0ABN3FS34_9ACTN